MKVKEFLLVGISILFGIILIGCTSLTPHIESNKSTDFGFGNIKNIYIYSDIGLVKKHYSFETQLVKSLVDEFLIVDPGMPIRWRKERVEFDIDSTLDHASRFKKEHLLLVRKAPSWGVLVSVYDVATRLPVYKATITMSGQILNQKSLAKEMAKTIVAELKAQ